MREETGEICQKEKREIGERRKGERTSEFVMETDRERMKAQTERYCSGTQGLTVKREILLLFLKACGMSEL